MGKIAVGDRLNVRYNPLQRAQNALQPQPDKRQQ